MLCLEAAISQNDGYFGNFPIMWSNIIPTLHNCFGALVPYSNCRDLVFVLHHLQWWGAPYVVHSAVAHGVARVFARVFALSLDLFWSAVLALELLYRHYLLRMEKNEKLVKNEKKSRTFVLFRENGVFSKIFSNFFDFIIRFSDTLIILIGWKDPKRSSDFIWAS